jgi:hypothetical protein
MSAVFDHSTSFEATSDKKKARGDKTMSMTSTSRRERTRRALQMEYRVLQVITFPVFLLIALLTFVLPRAIRANLPGLDVDGSLLARTRSLAGTSIPFVFMG